jgi:hypothetical protein
MPDPWPANPDRTHSTDHLPLWQMPVADNQPLTILITSIFVKLDIVDNLILDCRL